jgi:TRAP transporter TAXI family solute receptor
MHQRILFAALSLLVVMAGSGASAAQAQVQPPVLAGRLLPSQYGIAAKRPVVGASCSVCPWGAIAEILRTAMRPVGYELQICYNCSQTESTRIVSARRVPPPLTQAQIARRFLPPPPAPVDFGITNATRLSWAYHGLYDYKADPQKNLRLIALIENPTYILVAAKRTTGITDLGQIAARRMPVKIMIDGNAGTSVKPVLDYYGLNPEALARFGASLVGTEPENREAFDVIVSTQGSLANNTEAAHWGEISQKFDLLYLDLPADLLTRLAAMDLGFERAEVPEGLLRGIDRRIPTVARPGHAIYARDDTPEAFVYEVTKAMDENRHLLKYAFIPLSYDSRRVWRYPAMPLHPGAARYYREMRYMP